MATGKKSFLSYCDWNTTFEKLSDEEAGKLMKHILLYVNDFNPIPPDRLTELLFEPIKQQLKRDLVTYEKVCDRNKINGSLGGRPKNPEKPTGLIDNPEEPKKPDKDKDTDNDNDKEIEETIIPPKTWREDYEIFLNDLRASFQSITNDKIWIKEKERFHPNVDISLSIEKVCKEYWATDVGWKKKKGVKATKTIDWKATFTNSLNQKQNLVYKQTKQKQANEQPEPTYYKPAKLD